MHSQNAHEFIGVHVFGELYGVKTELLDDMELLRGALEKGIKDCGASLCDIQQKQFSPNGVTILALLSESHASIHTYPEEGALFFDAFTCGLTCKPERIADALVECLSPKDKNLQKIMRGPKKDSLQKTLELSNTDKHLETLKQLSINMQQSQQA